MTTPEPETDRRTLATQTTDVSLAQRLDGYAAGVRLQHPDIAAAIDELISRLKRTGAGGSAPNVGEALPPFVLPDETGRLRTLEELNANGPLVILLRRGHWCSYCRMSTEALVEIDARAKSLGGSFVAISPERSPFSQVFRRNTGAGFPVLTDADNGYALSLGLAFWLGRDLIAQLSDIGLDLPLSHGNDSWTLPIPATFVLDRRGLIVARHIDPDYRRRIEARDVLAALATARDHAPA